jgi:hypothetical protein
MHTAKILLVLYKRIPIKGVIHLNLNRIILKSWGFAPHPTQGYHPENRYHFTLQIIATLKFSLFRDAFLQFQCFFFSGNKELRIFKG